jgi:hypothetical protein
LGWENQICGALYERMKPGRQTFWQQKPNCLELQSVVLGMRVECHGDCKIEAHPHVHILTNLCPEMKATTHLLHSAGSTRPREAQAEAGGYARCRFRTRGFRAVMGSRRRSPSHRRLQDDEEAVLEVYPVDDVAGWTHTTSSFVEHGNICKSQRILMTP